MKQFDIFLKDLNEFKVNDKDKEKLHKLRISSRKLSSHINKKSKLYTYLRTLRKLSNEMRDLDVLENEFFESLNIKEKKTLLKLDLKTFIKNKYEVLEIVFSSFIYSVNWFDLAHKYSNKNVKFKAKIDSLRFPSEESKSIHKFRIKIKKLRYRIEDSETNENIDKLIKLQKICGKIHDLDMALVFLEDFLEKQEYKKFKKIIIKKRKSLYEEIRINWQMVRVAFF